MKRKRLEVRAYVAVGGPMDGSFWPTSKPRGEQRDGAGHRYVRLVECGPGEVVMPKAAAAVVRAAVKCIELVTDPSTAGSDGRADSIRALHRAVERMQKGRRK